MLVDLVKDHDAGDVDCAGCEEQFGECMTCGDGVIHCEYQETFRKENGRYVAKALLVLECDTCDDYESQ